MGEQIREMVYSVDDPGFSSINTLSAMLESVQKVEFPWLVRYFPRCPPIKPVVAQLGFSGGGLESPPFLEESLLFGRIVGDLQCRSGLKSGLSRLGRLADEIATVTFLPLAD